MVPGQELAVHTDVPEFRGVSRKTVPQWLLVVMHHSGLFDEYRLHIATGIAWFSDLDGGALAYWPDGRDGDLVVHPIRSNTALVLDTDSVFHGVDRVSPVAGDAMPPIRVGCELSGVDGRWVMAGPDGEVVTTYDWSELRLSVSWKAYCFADDAARDAWRSHADDLTLDTILDALVADLRAPARPVDRAGRGARTHADRRVHPLPGDERREFVAGRVACSVAPRATPIPVSPPSRRAPRSATVGRSIPSAPNTAPSADEQISRSVRAFYQPVLPSATSRRRSACPLWRAYSSIMCT